MAIPEPPPSSSRRSLLLLFLLLSLIGSLGLAYGLVGWKARNTLRPLDFTYRIPKGFVPFIAPKELPYPPIIALRSQIGGNERHIFVFYGQIDTLDDPANPLRGEVLGLYRRLNNAQPETMGPTVLDGQRSMDAWGMLPGDVGFAMLRGAIIDKRQFLAIAYRGAGEPVDEDLKIFNAFAGPSFTIITNQPPEKK